MGTVCTGPGSTVIWSHNHFGCHGNGCGTTEVWGEGGAALRALEVAAEAGDTAAVLLRNVNE